ncbi:MAG: hypothetical protein ACE5JL_18715, partial [Dehalococcoidia bacterium]
MKKRKVTNIGTTAGQLTPLLLIVPFLLGQASKQAQAPPPSATPAQGLPVAENLRVKDMHVAVWPEYDDPRVLTIIRGAFEPSTFQPTQVGFPLPLRAEIIGVGYISDKDELLLHPYEVVPGEGGDHIILALPLNRFFLEHYYQAFGASPQRAFTYEIPITYPVAKLDVRIQRPLAATNFGVEPPSTEIGADSQGFQYHTYQFTDVKPGTTLAFAIRYTKTDPSPSVRRQPTPPGPQAGLPPSPVSGEVLARAQSRFMPYLLGGLAVLGVGLIVLWAVGRVPGLARRTPCDGCERMIPTSHKFCPFCG